MHLSIPWATAMHILACVVVPILWGTVVHVLFEHGFGRRMRLPGDKPDERGA